MLTVETNIPMSPPLVYPKLNPAINVFDKLDFNKANWANLISAIKQIDWSTVLDPTSPTTCLIQFIDIISQICSLHTPIKGTKKAKKFLVFYQERKILMRKRTKLRKKVHTNPSISSKIMSIEQYICESHSKGKLYDETLAVTRIKSDPNFLRYAKKFSICTKAIGPLLHPVTHLLTDNKT